MKNSAGRGECCTPRPRPRWITPSEICRILHVLRKPNSIIALLFIQNIIFAQTCKLYSRPFLSLSNDKTLCPGFSVNGSMIFDVNDSIICSGLHFWRHFDVNSSIIWSGLHFWRHWFNMTEFLVNSSCLWWIMRVVLTNQNGETFWMNNNTSYLTELCVFWWLFRKEDTLLCLPWRACISLACISGHICAE